MRVGRSRKIPTAGSFEDEAADDYAHSRWMRRIQQRTTRRALELLQDQRIGGKLTGGERRDAVVLDLGCGNGFSSGVLQDHAGWRVIGLDGSMDMLSAKEAWLDAIHADMRYLPLRPGSISFLISISAMNFISEDLVDATLVERAYKRLSKDLSRVVSSKGRMVVEFYPKDEVELTVICNAFGTSRISRDAFLVIDKPGTRKEQKYLIIGRKE